MITFYAETSRIFTSGMQKAFRSTKVIRSFRPVGLLHVASFFGHFQVLQIRNSAERDGIQIKFSYSMAKPQPINIIGDTCVILQLYCCMKPK